MQIHTAILHERIARLLVVGLNAEEIARRVHLKPQTVRYHCGQPELIQPVEEMQREALAVVDRKIRRLLVEAINALKRQLTSHDWRARDAAVEKVLRLHGRLVVTTRQGKVPCLSSVHRTFKDVLAQAGLPGHHSCHSLRHTYASLLLARGEPLRFVQEQLGHHSIALTSDLYGKWMKTEPLQGGPNYLDTMTQPQTVSSAVSNPPFATRKGAEIVAIKTGRTISGSSSSHLRASCSSRQTTR